MSNTKGKERLFRSKFNRSTFNRGKSSWKFYAPL